MIADVGAIVWKEVHELWRTGSGRGGRVSLLLLLAVFGVFWPWEFGLSLGTAAVWLWLPMILIGQAVIDSFAGERERHTLDTLLASRLAARSIVVGKLAAGVAYGCVFTVLTLALAMLTASLTQPAGRSVLDQEVPMQKVAGVVAFSPPVLAAAAFVFLLIAAGVAAVAALVSMKSTVRQAGQTFGVAMAVILLVPVAASQLIPPEMRDRLASLVDSLGSVGGYVVVVAALVALDAVALGLCVARFQRADLVLE